MINSFGELSNADLLRRYGFIETEPNPHNCAEIALADILLLTGHPLGASSAAGCCHADQRSSTLHEKRGAGSGMDRLGFMMRCGLAPADGWFKVSQQGVPCSELVEAVRLCLLPEQRFRAFEMQVRTWRVPRVRPLSRATAADAPAGLHAALRQLCRDRMIELECAARTPSPTVSEDGYLDRVAVGRSVLSCELLAIRTFMVWLAENDSCKLMQLCAAVWRHPKPQQAGHERVRGC